MMFLTRKELGKWGEKKAEEYLKKNGYVILSSNFSLKFGEVDLIVTRKKYLVFVEVKTRRNDKYGLPGAAVDYKKRKKIKQVAKFYLQKNNLFKDKTVRFDVITIIIKDNRGFLQHFKNAF